MKNVSEISIKQKIVFTYILEPGKPGFQSSNIFKYFFTKLCSKLLCFMKKKHENRLHITFKHPMSRQKRDNLSLHQVIAPRSQRPPGIAGFPPPLLAQNARCLFMFCAFHFRIEISWGSRWKPTQLSSTGLSPQKRQASSQERQKNQEINPKQIMGQRE